MRNMMQSLWDKITLRNMSNSMTRNIKTFMNKDDKAQLSRQFTSWFAQSSFLQDGTDSSLLKEDVADFKKWLDTLSESEMHAFIEKVAQFCHDSNFELAWIFNNTLKNDVGTQKSLEEIILLYGLGYWKTVEIQKRIKAFATYQSWLSDPTTKKNRQRSQALFTRLVEMESISEPPSSLFLAPEEEREAYIIKEIKVVAEQNMDVLNKTLQAIAD